MIKEKIKSPFLIVIVLTFAIFIISLTAFYSQENFSSVCGCKLSPWVVIVSVSSFGIFIGSLIYYLLSLNNIKEKGHLQEGFQKILLFLEEEEKRIIEAIVNNSGEMYQSKLCNVLQLDKVKCSRIVSKLENKKILSRKKEGMTNTIILDKELLELLKNIGFKK